LQTFGTAFDGFVIRNVAPDIPLSQVIWGTLPFVLPMMVAVLLCASSRRFQRACRTW